MSDRVAELVRLLADAEAELLELTGGQVDAVVDPRSARTILLSRAQERLSASEGNLRRLLQRCPVLVVELDRNGCLIYSNHAVQSMFGYNESVLNDLCFDDLVVNPPTRGDHQSLVQEFFTRGASDLLLSMHGSAGDVHWIEWTTAPAGHEDRVLLFGVDVSHRKALMEEQVARSTAEAANHAKSEFLAIVSHELRTPLNAISGYAQLLETGIAGPLLEPQREYVCRIQRSQKHLLSMINDIIDFARLEAGKLILDIKEVSVHEVVALCETLTTPQAAEKAIDLTFRDGDRALKIWGDESKVEQVLVNLVTNAIKFTDSGGTVEVRTETRTDAVELIVSDTGAGIPKEKLDAVFQPFVQVETGHTRSRDGVGLGLAISRELARRMGGDLTVESEVRRGSTFTLTLPKAERLS